MSEEYLLLKWGTLKGWKIENDATRVILKKWHDLGCCASAMGQRDTPEQKQLICDLIDAIDGPISSDWSGEVFTKDGAKKYIMEYST